jgi:hypothetical protein
LIPDRPRASFWQANLLTLVFLVTVVTLSAQSLTVSAVADALRVQARDFNLIDGPVLARLKEGRSVRIDFELTVLGEPEGAAVTQVMQGFTLSFDLWEERFAVSRTGSPPRSVSHLRARDAESWCLQNLTIPVAALNQHGRRNPFWIRLAYRVQDVASAPNEAPGERFTIGGLIDRLSRRREQDDLAKSIEAGPFRLAN